MATKATTTANTAEPETNASPTAVGSESGTVAAPAKPIKQQGLNGAYYIVNPAGAIHGVTREHAKGRLAVAGWRMAMEDEIATYQSQEIQRHDRPIAAKWTPDPDAQIAEIE